ncbi:hypothetical protein COOONC_10416 [Cooperia oncophora]
MRKLAEGAPLQTVVEARHFLWDYLSEQQKRDRAVLLSSHSMEECEALCTRIGILCHGKLVETGAVQTLKSRCEIFCGFTYS